MPTCKNDDHKKYTGREKSPQGRGWCASAEKLGRKRIGKDKKVWEIVKKWEKIKIKKSYSTSSSTRKSSSSSSSSSSSPRKNKKKRKPKRRTKKKKKPVDSQSIKNTKANNVDIEKYVKKIYDMIKKNSKNWWNQLSTKNKIIVIYKNNNAEWESNKQHKELKSSKIKFILWLKHKDIGLDDFVRYVLNKVTIKHIEALAMRNNPLEYILENNNIFLKKNRLYSNKDYIPRYSSRTKMNEKQIYEKLKKSTVLKNKMKEQGWFSFLF